MALTFAQRTAVSKLAETLYSFLPASGNGNTSFPIAAAKVGLDRYWEHNSKLPAIRAFVEKVLLSESNKLVPFLEEVVQQSMLWRGTGERSLLRSEVKELNERLLALGYKSKDLSDPAFLSMLPDTSPQDTAPPEIPFKAAIGDAHRERLWRRLMEVAQLEPQPRGFAFENFLNDLFNGYGLSPSKPFRLVGEQIDGSFECASSTYLLEAKWVASRIGQSELLTFRGKVDGKSTWSRGLMISVNGFSEDGLTAFMIGKPTNIICMDGHDLYTILSGAISLSDAIQSKARRAAETNRAFVPLRELL